MQSDRGARKRLRESLIDGQANDLKCKLHGEFEIIEGKAKDTWVSLMGHDKGSHSGSTHLKGTEDLISHVLEKMAYIELSSVESFVLLCSVLLHDIGKIVDHSAALKLDKDPFVKRSMLAPFLKGKSVETLHHGIVSAAFILKNHESLGFSDFGIAECVAIVCAAHNLNTANELKKEGVLGNRFLDQYGRIRMSALCALLALGDELDNSYHRATPEWIKPSKDETNTKRELRAKLSGIEISKCGKLLVVHLSRDLYEPYIEDPGKPEKDMEPYKSNLLRYVIEDLLNKQQLLDSWRDEFFKMHIHLHGVALNVNGHLLDLRLGQDNPAAHETGKRLKLSLNLTYPAFNELLRKCDLKEYRIKKILSAENKCEIEVIAREYSNAMTFLASVLGKKEWYLNLSSLKLAVEPNIGQMKVERVLHTALQLSLRSFGLTTFPWETLASEAGIQHLDEIRLIFHRLSMLSEIFFHRPGEEKSRLLECLKQLGPESTNEKSKIIIAALDGEWSMAFSSTSGNERISYEETHKILKSFCQWLYEIIGGTNEGKKVPQSPKTQRPPKYIHIRNEELSYLLDETNPEHAILFPEIERCSCGESGPSHAGINLLITGPAGVGKSTLAMELISKGILFDGIDVIGPAINAYYSLEQPLESIRQMTRGLDLHDSDPLEFFPNSGKRQEAYINSLEKTKPVLLLLALAPRSYGSAVDEERLFWFRYEQISKLLEENRKMFMAGERNCSLSSIVIDNLNAFSRTPLARQQIQQLFRLISWYGVLGIHIIEHTPSSEITAFQSEVEFLADIVVRLSWIEGDYQYKALEVAKSRCQRHVLGKHPFKIRRDNGKQQHRLLDICSNDEPGFQVYPSIHSLVSKSEKESHAREQQRLNARFSTNEVLNAMVHKKPLGDTGIAKDALIVLQGRSGGHKLAIGMSYLHAKDDKESVLVINLGQTINYSAVADKHNWWEDSGKAYDSKPFQGLKWLRNPKVDIDMYLPPGKIAVEKKNRVKPPPGAGAIYVLNFHAGFLLPEEFLHIVKKFIEDINGIEDVNGGDKKNKITRVLFNSTGHLPERYPLLDKNPLLLHALVRLVKGMDASLMIIAVKGMGEDDRIMALAGMADLKFNIYDLSETRMPAACKRDLEKAQKSAASNVRIISSDNITGKDYSKEYRVFQVISTKNNHNQQEFEISEAISLS